MQERYLTSYEALCAGLRAQDASAIEASIYLLQSAHYSSRSQIVTFVGELDKHSADVILRAWFDAPWPAQSAAWWVLAYNERLHPPMAQRLRQALQPMQRIARDVHPDVAVQCAGWLYEYVVHVGLPNVEYPQAVVETLRAWCEDDDAQCALSSLQTLLALEIPVARTTAARVIAQAVDAGIDDADVLGMRCGFIESAERLTEQVLRGGPWADLAVQAFVQILPNAARKRFETVSLRWRLLPQDREVHVATILAAHGDADALAWLQRACQTRDPRRRAVAWAGRVRAMSRSSDMASQERLGKLLLREPESVRAWVLSTLDPSCAMQRQWLEQARQYGTEEERIAVEDALRAYALRRPLVPDAHTD